MAIEAITPALQAQAAAADTERLASPGYNASLADAARFEGAYGGIGGTDGTTPTGGGGGSIASLLQSGTVRTLMQPLQSINLDAQKLSGQTPGGALLPSEMMQLTIRSQQFLFHCELTSNVANRTSDGVQQLFRQQS
jgi:hypothetical protein